MNILVTGGLGFIGSNTCLKLYEEGHNICILDNLSNSKDRVIEELGLYYYYESHIKKLFINDILDTNKIKSILKLHSIDAVIHFAGYKAVGESVEEPLKYYENNVAGTLSLLTAMKEVGVKKLIFSSSASVYGNPYYNENYEVQPFTELDSIGNTTNPYSTSKYMIERILQDLYKSDNEWSIVILRYFNPIGSDENHIFGDDPLLDRPNNLMPYITRVASGKLPHLNIFGDNYSTHDGTGARDYIHVTDLAVGHIKALDRLDNNIRIYNLGTGVSYTVLDIVNTFERVNNVKVPYVITDRRPGDIDEFYADCKKAYEELEWKAEKTLEDMCRDSWLFELNKDKRGELI